MNATDEELKISPRELSAMESYTFSKRCWVDNVPEARTVWMKVGNQSFQVEGYQDTEHEANWMRLMLAKMIVNLQDSK